MASWSEVEQTLEDLREYAGRVCTATPRDVHVKLGEVLDFIHETPLLKECVESCRLEISEKELFQNLNDVVTTLGQTQPAFGRTTEGNIAFLYRAFSLLRKDLYAIRAIGTALSPGRNGREMIPQFGEKMVLRFVSEISRYFKRRRNTCSLAQKENSAGASGKTEEETEEGHIPKVFISYSQEDHKNQIAEIVAKLRSDGIEVVFDEYDLRGGHDPYLFMERLVNDPSISKVLIMCDRSYKEKANARRGGVGTETIIMAKEVYTRTSPGKFIPVVIEHDETGKACLPTFLESSKYYDLSNESAIQQNYGCLVRAIKGQADREKPPLGSPPDYVTCEAPAQHADLANALHQVQRAQDDTKRCAKLFHESVGLVIAALDALAREMDGTSDVMALTLPIRDCCLKITRTSFEAGAITAEDIGDAIEKIHSGISPLHGATSCPVGRMAPFDAFFQELFICLAGLLLEREEFGGLHHLLWRTYFLRTSWFDNQCPEASPYTAFRKTAPGRIPDLSRPGFHGTGTSNGTGLFETRELQPCWTKQKIQKADLFLFQMSEFKNRDADTRAGIWIPVTATHYGDMPPVGWSKLVSKRQCGRMLPLFGLETIEELKSALEKTAEAARCQHWDTLAYEWVLDTIPDITHEIRPDKIGSME